MANFKNGTNLPDSFIRHHIESVSNAKYIRLKEFKEFCNRFKNPMKLKDLWKAFNRE